MPLAPLSVEAQAIYNMRRKNIPRMKSVPKKNDDGRIDWIKIPRTKEEIDTLTEFQLSEISNFDTISREWIKNKQNGLYKCWFLQVFKEVPKSLGEGEEEYNECKNCKKYFPTEEVWNTPSLKSSLTKKHFNKNFIVTHHIDTNKSNNSPSNLIKICWSCHIWAHNKIKEITDILGKGKGITSYPFFKKGGDDDARE